MIYFHTISITFSVIYNKLKYDQKWVSLFSKGQQKNDYVDFSVSNRLKALRSFDKYIYDNDISIIIKYFSRNYEIQKPFNTELKNRYFMMQYNSYV